MTRIAQILATGSYVPERVVTNAEIDQLLGQPTGEWLEANVGIRERRWMSPEPTTSDLVVEASRQALAKAGVRPEQLNLIIVSTDTPDYLSPGTSVVVQYKLGAINAGAYDVNSACAGWVTALDQGARYLATDQTMDYVLVAGGYGMSRFLDLTDKKTANLFADGAGAAVLGVGGRPGFLSSNFLAKGEYYDALDIHGGGACRPSTPDNVATYGPPKVEFVKKFPRAFNTEYWPKLINGAPILQLALDHPHLARSLILVNPISPYGFGGTKGADGQPCYDDFAGAGGGSVNPEFVRRMRIGDRGADDANSPRNVINSFYYKPPFRAGREEEFLTSLLLEKTGPDRYPGDLTPSANWPTVAPGVLGPINAGCPKYLNLSGMVDMPNKPSILWIRGDSDQIVSDMSLFDFDTLGQLGAVPGWSGADVFPPQPMVSQTRAVLDRYAANGGVYREVVITDAGYSPHIEKPEAFRQALIEFLG